MTLRRGILKLPVNGRRKTHLSRPISSQRFLTERCGGKENAGNAETYRLNTFLKSVQSLCICSLKTAYARAIVLTYQPVVVVFCTSYKRESTCLSTQMFYTLQVTGTLFSAQRTTKSSPGSEMAGVPASVIRAQDSPAKRRAKITSPRSLLLCSK